MLDELANRKGVKFAGRLLIGGGMVFTFLAAKGHEVGSSLLEIDHIDAVRGYLETAQENGVEVVLPVDVVVADAFAADAAHDVVPADAMPAGRMGLDIGPESATLFAVKLRDAWSSIHSRMKSPAL